MAKVMFEKVFNFFVALTIILYALVILTDQILWFCAVFMLWVTLAAMSPIKETWPTADDDILAPVPPPQQTPQPPSEAKIQVSSTIQTIAKLFLKHAYSTRHDRLSRKRPAVDN